jgi:DMSO reductase family type II enzyme chaperone
MAVTRIQVDAIEVALARSAAHGLLAQAFRYPGAGHWSLLADGERWKAWPEILNRERPQVGDALRRLRDHVLSPDAERSFSIESTQAAFSRLFGHAVKGACPTYELEYGAGEVFQRVARLADLNGFYSAFGLVLKNDAHERADHVSVEFEFMSVMAAKEAYAEQRDEREGLETVRTAAGRFLEEHLGGWLPSLARRVSDTDPGGFYGTLGEFAARFIQSECESYGVSAGPRLLELRSVDDEAETVQRCAAEQPGAGCPMDAGGTAWRSS